MSDPNSGRNKDILSLFKVIDTDGDGFITMDELREERRRQLMRDGNDISEEQRQLLLSFMENGDADGDDKLSYEEFQHALNGNDIEPEESDDSSSSSGEETEELHQIFDAIDHDHDGFITLEEMLDQERSRAYKRGSVFDEMKKRSELKDFMRAGDLDRDERLDFREFVLAMQIRTMEVQMTDDSDVDEEVKRAQVKRMMSKRNSVKMRRQKSSSRMKHIIQSRRTVWERNKDQSIDAGSQEVRSMCNQLFEALDKQGKGHIGAEELMSHGKDVFEQLALDPTKADALAVLREKAKEGKTLDFEEFVSALESLKLTNDQLRKKTDEATHARVMQEDFNVEDISMEQAKSALTNMRLRLQREMVDLTPDVRREHSRAIEIGEALAWMLESSREELKMVEEDLREANTELQATKEVNRKLDTTLQKEARAALEKDNPDDLKEIIKRLAADNARLQKEVTDSKGVDQSGKKRTGGAIRSHAERNQEFFLLTTLAVKMNIESKYKEKRKLPPKMKATKTLYEEAMKYKVPFMYYYKWIERNLDPSQKPISTPVAVKDRKKPKP